MAGIKQADRGYPFRLTEEQRDELRTRASEAGLTIQAYLELTVFGEIRQRPKYGPRPYKKPQGEELPLTG